MKRTVIAALAALGCALTSVPAVAAPAALPVASEVRVRAPGLGDGWLDGKVARSSAGCVMVKLAKTAPGGYSSVSLGGVASLQLRSGGTWQDVDVKPIHAAEASDCKGDND